MEDSKSTKQWVSIDEAARFLGVSQDTLRRWEQKGKLIPRRTMGGHRRYARRQLDRVLKQSIDNISEIKASFSNVRPQPTKKSSAHKKPESITTSISSSRYRMILHSIKSNALTIFVGIAFLLLVAASILLVQMIRAQTQSKFVSPLPTSTTPIIP